MSDTKTGRRGGARPGSGRKSTGLAAPVAISFRLTPTEAAALDALCLPGEERAGAARRIVRAALTPLDHFSNPEDEFGF